MSKRRECSVWCNFCGQKLYEVEGVADTPTHLFCYGCRERKDSSGWGHKSDLRDGVPRQ